jgi:tetratricopeptide (TPR) repeat protein
MAVDKAKLLKSAEKSIASGKIPQAIDDYLKILKENQRDWNLMIQVGDLYLKINKTAEAIQHFQRVADHYYLDGFYLKAIAIYKRINKLDPSLTDICIKLADLYLKQGLTMDAKSQLQVVAQHYVSKNQTKDAIQTLKKLIEIEPDNLRTRNELAKAYKNEGMIGEAVNEYLEISDELLRKNLYKESLTVLETAYKMDPRSSAILRKILAIYSEQGEPEKATSMLEETLRADPANPDVLALLAETYAAETDFPRAHQTIDQAILNTGNKEPFWILKGDLYLKEGDLANAFTQYEQAIDRQVKRKEPEKSVSLLQKITALDSTFHPALERLVNIYTSNKQPAEAVTSYNHLVDALISKSLYSQAADNLEKLIELEPDNEQHQEKLEFVRSFLDKPQQQVEATQSVRPVTLAPPSPEVVSEDIDIEVELELPPQPAPKKKAKSVSVPTVPKAAPKPEPTSAQKPSSKAPQVSAPAAVVAESTEEEKDFVSEHLIEADVFTKYGLVDKAIEQLHMITSKYPNSVIAHQKLKEIYLEKGERDHAVEECITMSRIFRKQGDLDQAEDLLSEARQINPNHPSLDRAFKEIPSTAGTTDVLGEIEKLAQSLRSKSGSFRAAKPQPPPSPPPQPPKPEPVMPEEEEIEIDVEVPVEELEEKTPVSALSPEKFEEIDFYMHQGLNADALRLLDTLKEKHPDDAGVISRLWKISEQTIRAQSAPQPDESMLLPASEIIGREQEPEGAEVEEEIEEAVLEEEIPSELESVVESPIEEVSLEDIQSEPEELQHEPEPEYQSSSSEYLQAGVDEIVAPEFDMLESSAELTEIPVEEPETIVQEEPVVSQSEFQERIESEVDQSVVDFEIHSTREPAPEQTWDMADLPELGESMIMVPEPEQEEDSSFEKAMGAAIDMTAGDEEEEEEEEAGQKFPAISEAEMEAPEFNELEMETPEMEEGVPASIPANPEVDTALDEAFAEKAEEFEAAPQKVQAPELFEEEDDFFDLAAELEEGLLSVQNAVQDTRPPDGQNYSLEEILSDFKKGVEKQLGAEDYDTRYNLGIAYKEMGLIDEAIAEFQIASKDPKKFLECCSMLGICFGEKGMPKLAVKWYQKGLDTAGYSEDEYQGLRFDMAQAYESMGELERALELYQEVYGIHAGYRNVHKKIKELQDQLKKK